jgi:ubiquitin-like protein Pup
VQRTAVTREDKAMSEQARKTTSTRSFGSDNDAPVKAGLKEKGHKLGEEMDALIDEIDGLLEENAAEFVESYVQRGGQ